MNLQADVTAGDAPFQLDRGAFGDDPTAVQDSDSIGEVVGLVEVLGCEQDRDPVCHQLSDDLPHGPPAGRIEPGGGLVEKDHPRRPDQGHGQIESPAHPPGVGRHGPPRRVGQIEPVEEILAPGPPDRTAQMVQVGHQLQVVPAG